MTRTYLLPDQGKQIAELERRLAVLERRIPERLLTPTATGPSHDGAGVQSVLVTRSDDTIAEADGLRATAVGVAALASVERGTAVGFGANAATRASAVGAFANANHTNAVALGDAATTTAINQVNMGTSSLFCGCPTSAPSNGLFLAGQMSIWVNEAGNLLTFKVKYASGTVKSGTVALA